MEEPQFPERPIETAVGEQRQRLRCPTELLHAYICVVSAGFDFYNSFSGFFFDDNDTDIELHRERRQNKKLPDFEENNPTCADLRKTSYTPFIVLVLHKTSGHFLGMGSIIAKRTILSASKVVEISMRNPQTLVVLAGRYSPWWGEGSQVRRAVEIYLNEVDLALVVLGKDFVYNKFVRPIKVLGLPLPADLSKTYDKHWAVFGVPRSGWDMPGQKVSKSSIYMMKVETLTQKKEHEDACQATYPEVFFNKTSMTCLYANGSFCWGCLGSPTVAMSPLETLVQLAVITRASHSEVDEYNIAVKVGVYEQWIRSHGVFGFTTFAEPAKKT